MRKLDGDLLDGLTEIINIGTGMAANALFQLLHHEVLLNVPEVQVISYKAAANLISSQSSSDGVSAVSMQFSGPMKGTAFLLFSEADTTKITKVYIGEDVSAYALGELEKEVVLEMGNIILSSCLAGLGNMLGGEYLTDLPYYYHGPVTTAFSSDQDGGELNVLFVKVRFDVQDIDVTGYVALVMGVSAMDSLLNQVQSYIASLEGEQHD